MKSQIIPAEEAFRLALPGANKPGPVSAIVIDRPLFVELPESTIPCSFRVPSLLCQRTADGLNQPAVTFASLERLGLH